MNFFLFSCVVFVEFFFFFFIYFGRFSLENVEALGVFVVLDMQGTHTFTRTLRRGPAPPANLSQISHGISLEIHNRCPPILSTRYHPLYLTFFLIHSLLARFPGGPIVSENKKKKKKRKRNKEKKKKSMIRKK